MNSPVQDPAQSWNSISVGAYTLKDEPTLIRTQYINFQPIAKSGSLSPSSRTSLLWDSKWPIKRITCMFQCQFYQPELNNP
ncbi:S8 family serine peptidase [Lysinibacillus xylanilyticus]|uniref:S8 family serine peptidase n=1 Tax=Lysinibacillus xylanilyticus TaxID=582475 RepID=UPI0037FB1F70